MNNISCSRIKLFSLVILCLAFLAACQKAPESSIEVIDLDALDVESNGISISEIFQLERVLPLETSERTFMTLEKVSRVISDSLLLIKTNDRILLFNLNNGALESEIAKKGPAPEEFYRSNKGMLVYSEIDLIFAMKKPFEMMSYGELEVLKSITIPDITDVTEGDVFSKGFMVQYAILADKSIVGYMANMSGDEKIKLVQFDSLGDVIKIYPNHLTYKKRPGFIRFDLSSFHFYRKDLFFKEVHNDTLFRLYNEKLSPQYVFKSKNRSPIYDKQDFLSREDRDELYLIHDIFQDDAFIYFLYRFRGEESFGVYSKEDKWTKFIDQNNQGVSLNGFILPPGFIYKDQFVFVTEAWRVFESIPEAELKSEFGITPSEDEQNPILFFLKRKKQ